MSQISPSVPPAPTGDASADRTALDDRTMRSRADVTTVAPVRYAKQLIAHLGRTLTFVGDATTSPATAAIGAATAGIAVGDGVLILWASGDDEESVARVEQVLGGHLERFGRRGSLTVRWVRTDGASVLTPMSTTIELSSEEQS